MQGEQERVEVWERRPGASLQPLRRYRRREPEKTLLHAVVSSRLEPFLAALALTPDELLARIATLVPPPRSHALRYHGLFAPNSKRRARVVPTGRAPGPGCPCAPSMTAATVEPASAPPVTPPPKPATRLTGDGGAARYRVPWAELLRKVFAVDVLECPRCAGRLQLVAYIADGGVARRILDHLGMQSQAPPLERAPSPEELPTADPAPDYDVADPTWDG